VPPYARVTDRDHGLHSQTLQLLDNERPVVVDRVGNAAFSAIFGEIDTVGLLRKRSRRQTEYEAWASQVFEALEQAKRQPCRSEYRDTLERQRLKRRRHAGHSTTPAGRPTSTTRIEIVGAETFRVSPATALVAPRCAWGNSVGDQAPRVT